VLKFKNKFGSLRVKVTQHRIFESTCSLLFVCWYRACSSFWPMTNLAKLAGGPAVYVRLQGGGICFISSASSLSLSLYDRLAPSLSVEYSTVQKLMTYKYLPTFRRIVVLAFSASYIPRKWSSLCLPYLIQSRSLVFILFVLQTESKQAHRLLCL
jgi:hypothetical protein